MKSGGYKPDLTIEWMNCHLKYSLLGSLSLSRIEASSLVFLFAGTMHLAVRVCSHLNIDQREDLNQSSVAAMAMPAA